MSDTLGILDMEDSVHRLCLFLVYQPRIQQSLNEAKAGWNLHKIRTEGNRTPVALYELSKQKAIHQGYWTGDPGDSVHDADHPNYGYDPEAPLPPANELRAEDDPEAENTNLFVNADEHLDMAREILAHIDLDKDDGERGIAVYVEAVQAMYTYISSQ